MVKGFPGLEDQEQLMGEVVARPRRPGTADGTMAEAVAPLEDEMMEMMRLEKGKLIGDELH